MKFTAKVDVNLDILAVLRQVEDASRKGMRDVTVEVHAEAVQNSPVETGNNRRSIASEVSGMGLVASGGEGGAERVVNESKIEGAVYSTSGYGSYLETGTQHIPARPYFGPARDRFFTEDNLGKAIERHLG